MSYEKSEEFIIQQMVDHCRDRLIDGAIYRVGRGDGLLGSLQSVRLRSQERKRHVAGVRMPLFRCLRVAFVGHKHCLATAPAIACQASRGDNPLRVVVSGGCLFLPLPLDRYGEPFGL